MCYTENVHRFRKCKLYNRSWYTTILRRIAYILTVWLFLHLSTLCKGGWFYAVLLWFDSLMMIPWGSKHVVVFKVILWYKTSGNSIVHFVGLSVVNGLRECNSWFRPQARIGRYSRYLLSFPDFNQKWHACTGWSGNPPHLILHILAADTKFLYLQKTDSLMGAQQAGKGDWSTPRPLYPWEWPGTHCMRLGGPQGRSGRARKISPLPGSNLYWFYLEILFYIVR